MANYTADEPERFDFKITSDQRDQFFMSLCEEHFLPLDGLLQFLQSIHSEAFYSCDQVPFYSTEQSIYIRHVYPEITGSEFKVDMVRLASALLDEKSNHDGSEAFGLNFTPIMDKTLSVIGEQIRHIKVFERFDRPTGLIKDVDNVTEEDIKKIKTAAAYIADEPTTFEAGQFALPWLQFHIAYNAKKIKAKKDAVAEAIKTNRKASSDDGDFAP